MRLGIDNAVSLVVDDTVIFQDSEGRPGDLPDLILALSEHASVFGRGFREMKLAVEHEEANLHLLVRGPRRDPAPPRRAVGLRLGGRPHPATWSRGQAKRRTPTARASSRWRRTPACSRPARMQFQSFVGRLEAALHAALPEATVEEKRADAVVVRPTTQPTRRAAGSAQPVYDPYAVYYPSPMSTMLDVMLISSFMTMMMPPPMIMVVHPSGAPIGAADTISLASRGGRGVGASIPGDVARRRSTATAARRRRPMADGSPTTRTSTAAATSRRRWGFDGGDFGGGDF